MTATMDYAIIAGTPGVEPGMMPCSEHRYQYRPGTCTQAIPRPMEDCRRYGHLHECPFASTDSIERPGLVLLRRTRNRTGAPLPQKDVLPIKLCDALR